MVQKNFPGTWWGHLVGTPGRDTWWGHLVGTPGRDTWWGHLVGTPGRGTYDQHESLRLRRAVLQFTLPTSREHITLTHSHSRTYTPKDIIRTQKINLLGKKRFSSKPTSRCIQLARQRQRTSPAFRSMKKHRRDKQTLH